MNITVNRELAAEIQEVIEDTVGYLCDENMLSGEIVWTMLECLAQAKVAELEDDLTVSRMEKLSKKKATPATKSDRPSDW